MYPSIAVVLLTIVGAHAAPDSGSICQQEPYKALLPLSTYAPVQSFCAKNYPASATTTTVTVTQSACIATATTPSSKRSVDASRELEERDLEERGLAAVKRAMGSTMLSRKIIKQLCQCILPTSTTTSTATTSLTPSTPLPSCCNNAPFAEIRQSGGDRYGVCKGCAYSEADGYNGIENYPYNTQCDFVQYCTDRCEQRGNCQGVMKTIPSTNNYPNCKFLANAVGGGSSAADSDTIYKLPASVPLCDGTRIAPAQCACGGGGPCIPV